MTIYKKKWRDNNDRFTIQEVVENCIQDQVGHYDFGQDMVNAKVRGLIDGFVALVEILPEDLQKAFAAKIGYEEDRV